jgi:hypothetical protein
MNGKPSIIQRVHLIVSPFERTLQTAVCLWPQFEHRVVQTSQQAPAPRKEIPYWRSIRGPWLVFFVRKFWGAERKNLSDGWDMLF